MADARHKKRISNKALKDFAVSLGVYLVIDRGDCKGKVRIIDDGKVVYFKGNAKAYEYLTYYEHNNK
jgi:hypothetical protein